MSIERLHSGPKLSRVVKHNGLVYLCGQVAKDYSGDITEQTRTMLERVDEHLAEAGSDRSQMLTATVYVKNAADIKAMNEVWGAWLDGATPPARTCVVAGMANPDILVEITITAAHS